MQTAKSGKEKKLNKIVPVLLVLAAAGIFLIACRLLRLENRGMTRSAVTAALYVVLCTLFSPISFGAVQLRVADALALLPVFGLPYVAGVTAGCFLANLLFNGIIDAVFGSAATLLAAVLAWRLRRSSVRGLALLPALVTVLVNAAVVGLELALFYSPDRTFAAALLPAMLGVGAGELVSCLVLGVAMVRVIEASPTLRRLAEGEKV